MWDPQRLTTLWAFTACYRDSFTICYISKITVFDRTLSTSDHTTLSHSTLNLLSVLSLVFTILFLETDLSQSHCHFKYRCNCSICTVFNSHAKSSWHSLISCCHLRLPTRWIPIYDSLNSDSILDNSLFDIFHLLSSGHSTVTTLTSK
jgi:hypothetical protein